MAPVSIYEETPMSRTHQYRKVMKPLLERKRRARINKYLDELKDLMVEALHAEGESMTKLEKADVLEMTVNHLRKLKRQEMLAKSAPSVDLDRYNAGYTACANEVSRYLSSVPGIDIRFGTSLMSHLGSAINKLTTPLSVNTAVPSYKTSPSVSPSSDAGYNSGRETISPPPVKKESVWRPF